MQAGINFFEDLLANLGFAGAELQATHEGERIGEGQVGNVCNGLAADLHAEDGRVQARATAGGAGDLAHVLFVAIAGEVRFGFFVLALDVLLHALESGGVATFAAESVAVGHLNFVVLAVQNRGAGLGGQVLEGGVQVEAELLPQAREQAQPVFGGCFALRPGGDSALAEGQVGVGYEQFGVYFQARADAVAGATCAERRVEGEGARLDGVDLQRVVVGAGEVFAEGAGAFGVVLLAVHEVDEYAAVGEFERGFDGIGQALVNTVLNDDAVDDHLDGVLVLLGELGRVGELHGFAVHAGARVALGQQVLEEVHELALTCADDGREDLQAGAFGVFLQNVHDLLRGLLGDFFAADGTVRVANSCPEQTHVVVDFGDGADG